MKRIEDERIIYEKRRINSNAFGLCFFGLWFIVLLRQFIWQQNINEYLDIFLLTIGISIYVTINNVFKGLYLTYRNKKERRKVNLLGVVVGAIIFAIVQFYIVDFSGLDTLISLVVFVAAWWIAQEFLQNLSEKKANQENDE